MHGQKNIKNAVNVCMYNELLRCYA